MLTSEVIVRYVDSLPARRSRVSLHREVGTRLVGTADDFRMDVVRADDVAAAIAAARAYERDPSVAFAEVGVKRFLRLTPDDTHYANGDLWGLNNTGQSHVTAGGGTQTGTSGADIDAPQAWDVETGDTGTVVAVIDTGVALTHPDLQNNLWVNTGETPSDGIDNDGNGRIDDVNGFDFADLDGNPNQTSATCGGSGCPAHGTHVAGTIAAEFDNAEGVAGVCPGCRIMAIKVATGSTSNFTTTGRLIQAYDYVSDMGADVVNGSYGGPIWSKAERAALKTAGQTSLFVFAAGNNALDNDVNACRGSSVAGCSPSYPASYTLNSILSVAASNDADHYGYHSSECGSPQQCVFSNWGRTSVDVAAPGVDIISTRPGDAYFTIDGTSMAAPHVSGLAGLVRSANPAHTPVDLKNAIMNSAAHPAALDLYVSDLGFSTPIDGDFTVTQGRIDADAALSAPLTNATPGTDGVPSGANGIRKSKQGALGFPDDLNDFYRKKLRKGVKYKVTLTVPGGANFDVILWRPGITETWPLTTACYGFGGDPCPIANAGFKTGQGADEAFTFKPGKGGVYLLHVTSFFADGNYTVKIVKV